MPVAIKISPVMIPALCSSECQLSLINPLYANRIHNNIPPSEMTEYMMTIENKNQRLFVPANKK